MARTLYLVWLLSLHVMYLGWLFGLHVTHPFFWVDLGPSYYAFSILIGSWAFVSRTFNVEWLLHLHATHTIFWMDLEPSCHVVFILSGSWAFVSRTLFWVALEPSCHAPFILSGSWTFMSCTLYHFYSPTKQNTDRHAPNFFGNTRNLNINTDLLIFPGFLVCENKAKGQPLFFGHAFPPFCQSANL